MSRNLDGEMFLSKTLSLGRFEKHSVRCYDEWYQGCNLGGRSDLGCCSFMVGDFRKFKVCPKADIDLNKGYSDTFKVFDAVLLLN